MEILNIPQLRDVVDITIKDYNKFLKGNIRVIGLKEKIIRRKKTMQKILDILEEHIALCE